MARIFFLQRVRGTRRLRRTFCIVGIGAALCAGPFVRYPAYPARRGAELRAEEPRRKLPDAPGGDRGGRGNDGGRRRRFSRPEGALQPRRRAPRIQRPAAESFLGEAG